MCGCMLEPAAVGWAFEAYPPGLMGEKEKPAPQKKAGGTLRATTDWLAKTEKDVKAAREMRLECGFVRAARWLAVSRGLLVGYCS